ncbi:MAG: hypothetical protein KatS3mg057_0504 [Herpetosiphonaceae bacterium]|nr:MAG: hypothetical protein KatS3mg057_0504 [Herpetosiphonaceae bacterium]
MIHVQLFGTLRLDYAGQIITGLNTSRLQALLAYLVLHADAPLPRKHLAYLFWPDSQESQAHTNLRNLLHRLRRLLPDADTYLEADAVQIRWKPDAPYTCDVHHFQQAIDQAQSLLSSGEQSGAEQALRKAIQLYQDDLLPGCYDDWIVPLREQLRQQFFWALDRLLQLLETRQAYDEAVTYGHIWISRDPLAETAYQRLMRFYALKGDRAGTLRTYHACASVLQRELGVEPAAPTQELYRRLLQSPEPTPAPLPRDTALPLVGRQRPWQRLRTIWQAVQAGQFPPQCVLITGEAGIGKSRLAQAFVEWVQRLGFRTAVAQSYPAEGHLAYAPVTDWLRQSPLGTLPDIWRMELARLLPELLDEYPHLLVPPALTESWQRQRFFEALAHGLLVQRQPFLLSLEDAHWTDRETLEWLHYLLRFDLRAQFLLLLTARQEELGLNHPLTLLTGALQQRGQFQQLKLERLNQEETASLGSYLAGAPLAVDAAASLYAQSEGNPLFVVEMWRAGLATTGQPDRPLPERLQGVLTVRLAQLSEPARRLAEAAAVIGRSFRAPVLARAASVDEGSLVHDLDELWQRRIIQEQGPDTYDFTHEKLRQVAYALLSPIRRQRLHRQVADALTQLEPESYGQQAFHLEHAGAYSEAIVAYLAAARLDLARSAFTTARETLEHVLALASHEPGPEEAEAWLMLAHVYEILGDNERQQEAVAKAMALATALNSPALQTRALVAAGRLATRTGNHEEAMAAFKRAQALAEQHGDRVQELDLLLQLGELTIRAGDFEAAQDYFQRGLALARENQDRAQEAEALDGLGFILPMLGGDLHQAEHVLQEALALRRSVGDQVGEVRTLTNLVSIWQSRGAYDRVLQAAPQVLEKAAAIGYRRGLAVVQGSYGLAACALGDFGEARRQIRQARDQLRAMGDIVGACIHTDNLGLVAEREGKLTEAALLFDEALALARQTDARLFEALAQLDRGRLYLKQDRPADAIPLLEAAYLIFAENGDMLNVSRCQVLLGLANLALDRRTHAGQMADAAWQLYQDRAHSLEGDELLEWYWYLRQLLLELGREEQAAAVLCTAHAYLCRQAESITDPHLRDSFLHQVPINRQILAAHRASTGST